MTNIIYIYFFHYLQKIVWFSYLAKKFLFLKTNYYKTISSIHQVLIFLREFLRNLNDLCVIKEY
jgi:hypothetical protein